MLGNETARGHDHQLPVLPLDRLDAAEARKDAAAGDVENAAMGTLDESMAAAHVLHDPVRQNFFRQLRFDWRRRRADVWEAAIAAELADDGCGAFLVWGDPAIYDSTIAVLVTSTVPMITGPSRSSSAVTDSAPMPGQRNSVSVTTAPPTSAPRSMPSIVTTGRSAFRSA